MNAFNALIIQIQGLGVDGASVVLSEQNGVAGLIKRSNPFCVPLHCVCHRLHLAVSKAAKSIPNVNTLQSIVANVYQFINNSPNRLTRFNSIARLLAAVEDGNAAAENENELLPTYKFLRFKKVFHKIFF